jgi:glucokinase
LAEAYHAGDKLTRKAIHRSTRYLSYGLASFLNIFNPEMVILGGGLIEALGSIYLERVQKLTQKYVFPVAFQNVKIVPALLADDAVILGASVLAFEALAESIGR